ncbi:MAG TPA: hypothetical protein VFD59_01915 [Nocardioidaceae bacterium]|nr:hypothetical protein [Nocardioidaceae bacterium]
MKKAVLALVTVTLVLSGCGGGSEDADASTAISESMMDQGGNDLLNVKQEEADCIGDGMVEDIGVGELKEYGFLKEDGTVAEDPSELEMSSDDAESMTNTMFDCSDVMAMMDEAMASSMGGQDPAVKECVEDVLTEDLVKEMFTAMFSGDEEGAQEGLMGPMTECISKSMGG